MKLEIIEDNWNCFLFGEVNGSFTANVIHSKCFHTNIKIAKLSSKTIQMSKILNLLKFSKHNSDSTPRVL